eukprot:TRINITY_DN11233_c0_g1_i1.p1 TRINITY_DN11233_c0_g1~~TRINITY_DN11233_c0_g1_i1.p1  ORF type:complete len:367 (+),score=52.29 TRINITY_DN11233_c0_g1_i1:30-1130(+)
MSRPLTLQRARLYIFRHRQRVLVACICLVVVIIWITTSLRSHDYAEPPAHLTRDVSFKIVEYYNRPEKDFDGMVSIVTQVSPNRLDRIVDMAKEWQGPMSVAVYIHDNKDLKDVDLYLKTHPPLRDVGVHLLYYNKTRYPVNNLRNLAVRMATTPWVAMLDADFFPSEKMNKYLNDVVRSSGPKSAFILPAFNSDLATEDMPRTKQDIMIALMEGKASIVNEKLCYKCHNVTNYRKWYFTDKPFQIYYRWVYEPFLVYNREAAPPFPTIFKGYGFDKNTWVYSLAILGWEFFVVPDAFITHRPHVRNNWDGKGLDDQLMEALALVCEVIPNVKRENGRSPQQSAFGEPVYTQGEGKEICAKDTKWF